MRLPLSLWSIAGVPLNRALPGFPVTAHLPVCVPDVIGGLAVWRQKKKRHADLAN